MNSLASTPDVDPYQLQQLVAAVVPQHGLGFASGPRAPAPAVKVSVTCAQALGSEIYVGCSDGSLLRFALQADTPNSPERYQLLSRQTVPTNKPVTDIALAAGISRVLVHTDFQIHFYTLPSLDPAPTHVVKPIRNALYFAVDEQHLKRPLPSMDSQSPPDAVDFCVIKRSNVGLYTLRERLLFQKEIPLPIRPTAARRSGQYLCISDAINYNMIDLQNASLVPLIPIVQVPDDTAQIKPSISVVSEGEFLILSSMGSSTMGLFITGRGDPVRGTLQWEMYPDSICVDSAFVAAFLPDRTIEIHRLETQERIQSISLPEPSRIISPALSSPEFRALFASCNGYLVPSSERTERLKLVPVPLLPTPPTPPSSPPPIPPPKAISSAVTHRPVFPRSNVLVMSDNSIHSLLPATLLSQAENLMKNKRIQDVVDLANDYQRKLLGNISHDEDQAEELRYIYQRIGLQCLSDTLFEDAGKHLLSGDVDPRLLVRYFPVLRGNLFDSSSTVDVYSGVVEHLPPIEVIEEITKNPASNFTEEEVPVEQPNEPDTRSPPMTAGVRHILRTNANEMLAAYLRKCRRRRLIERARDKGPVNPKQISIDSVVDTVLVKIMAESEHTEELYDLIDEPNSVVLSEVEGPLKKNGQYGALCKLYRKAGEENKLLEIYSKIADGVWIEEDVPSPLTDMTDILGKTKDLSLVKTWGLWLVKKDVDLGLKILISRDSKRSSRCDDSAMLNRIQAVSPQAGARFLEYLVLQKHSDDEALHAQLAANCVAQLLQCLKDEATAKLWMSKGSLYASTKTDSPFLSYFTSTTSDSEAKRIRLKTALLLQGGNLSKIDELLESLHEHEKILRLEIAILYGRLHRHREAIHTLVHDIRDSTSAETYCTLGGDVISARIASAIGERFGMKEWAVLVTGSEADARQKTADESTKTELLKVLLEVYMSEGESTAERTARLLNSQAINLDVVDVISLVPPDWSLSVISSFLSRSLRRTLHDRHEGHILKAISAGQNLEVAENTWMILREQGATLEEPVEEDEADGDDDEKGAGEGGVDLTAEKVHLMEKLSLEDEILPATEIAIPPRKTSLITSPSANPIDPRTISS